MLSGSFQLVADGYTVTRPQDLGTTVQQALKNRRPCVIDVHVDADVRPPSTGTCRFQNLGGASQTYWGYLTCCRVPGR